MRPDEKLVKQRKTKDELEPDDVLVIPRNADAEQARLAEAEQYNKTECAIVGYAELVEGEIEDIERDVAKSYDVVGHVNRKKLDGADERELVETLLAATELVAVEPSGIAKLKAPLGGSFEVRGARQARPGAPGPPPIDGRGGPWTSRACASARR